MQEKEKEKYKIAKGKKKRRAFKWLLVDMNSYFNSALSLLGVDFLHYCSILIMSSWARLSLCSLKK